MFIFLDKNAILTKNLKHKLLKIKNLIKKSFRVLYIG
tara:strand:- start:2 stop:112 length:111 start_codon:yes stop_codon:yes gene_type:complete